MADLNQLVSIEDLRQVARRRLPRAIFDFFDGGAEDEVTLRENRAAFERVRLLPKVLVNVAKVDMSAELFGVLERHHRGVPMCEVGNLVGDHRLQLAFIKEVEKALCQDDRRSALPEADR